MLKIEIAINIEIILFIVLFIITKQIELYLLFIMFLLIHEISHMVFGMALGFGLKKMIVMPFGFKIQLQESKEDRTKEIKKIIIAFAGPFINFAIIGLSRYLKLPINIIYINLIIAGFNLIPIYPLDGGRIIKSVLNMKFEPQKVNKIVHIISNISIIFLTAISSIIILYIRNINILFPIGYLWYVVIKDNKKYRILNRVYDIIESNKVIESKDNTNI